MAVLLWSLSTLPLLTLAIVREYVIYPADRRDKVACSHTTRALSSIGEVVQMTSYTSALRGVTEFWLVKADSTAELTIRGTVGVRNTRAFLTILPQLIPK